MKLDQAIREYIISLSTAEGKAKNTVESYSRDLKQYSDYLKENNITDTSKIKEETIYSYIDDLNDRCIYKHQPHQDNDTQFSSLSEFQIQSERSFAQCRYQQGQKAFTGLCHKAGNRKADVRIQR